MIRGDPRFMSPHHSDESGEIVEHGETQSLFENPSHPYTQQLVRLSLL